MEASTISTTDSDETVPFSAQLRSGTTTEHNNAEHSKTMTDLINCELTLEEFVRMQAQHAFVYKALEDAIDSLALDPRVAVFADERLRRSPSMSRDLDTLGTDLSSVTPTEATSRYVERIGQMAREWPPGVIAHHYTRYLGDLSGGQFICRVVERTYDIDASSGTSFFHFTDIDDISAFKNEYRDKLDSIELSDHERTRFIEEVMAAYALSTDLFFSLDELV